MKKLLEEYLEVHRGDIEIDIVATVTAELEKFVAWLEKETVEQSAQATGLCPFCDEPIASEFDGIHQFCYPAESPRA